jgi:hypothetical protein
MAIKKYFAVADNTITNAFEENLNTRGTGSNMGQSDIIEVFSIYAQQSRTSAELSRGLIQFDIDSISTDRSAGTIPDSGSVSFYLKLYNAEHTATLPKNFYIEANAVSANWEEGNGLDMDNYTDLTYDFTGSNWIRRAGSTSWSTEGGDWHTDSSSSFKQYFPVGTEDIDIDITTLVEQWLNSGGNVLGSKDNYGFIIKLTASNEASSSTNEDGAQFSYYTKKFFARGTEFFFERPSIEAKWDSSRRDNRGNLYYSSSWAPPSENLNTLFLYNYVRGRLRDIAGSSTQIPVLNLYYASASVPEGDARYFRDSSNSAVNYLSASRVSEGVYKATFSVTSSIVSSTYPYLVDVWTYSGSQIQTGSAITPLSVQAENYDVSNTHVLTMPKMLKKYSNKKTERFRLFVRDKGWSPNIYTRATSTIRSKIIESASYQIMRVSDQKVVVPYGTGSDNYTMLSYDVSGNYFDFDMRLLESGYTYAFKYSFYDDAVAAYREQPYLFKFKVENDEY